MADIVSSHRRNFGFHELQMQFSKQWLGLENEELQAATRLASAGFCHKGGFLMTVGDEADAIRACEISLEEYEQKPVIVCLWDAGERHRRQKIAREKKRSTAQADSGYDRCTDLSHDTSASSGSGRTGHVCGDCDGEKEKTGKKYMKEFVKQILECKPEAVYVTADLFAAYPVVHALRKKHMPVLMRAKEERHASCGFLRDRRPEREEEQWMSRNHKQAEQREESGGLYRF